MRSHPMWVRGLKLRYSIINIIHQLVASYVGAWIETLQSFDEIAAFRVASYVGAWIETVAFGNG